MQSPSRSTWDKDVLLGALHVLPLLLGALPFGLLLGSLAAQAGLSPAEVALMSGLIFAGSAQFVAVEQWAEGVPGAAIVGSILLINLRHLLLGAAITPYLGGRPLTRLSPILFFMTDESWALAMRRGTSLTMAYWAGVCLTLYVGWLTGTVTGALLGALVADPAALGLDFASTAVFVCLLAGFWKGSRSSVMPWLVSAVTAAVVHHLSPGGTWYILAGGVAGALVAALPRRTAA